MSAEPKRERTLRWCALGIALGSALLLAGALGFQYLGHLPPCELCLYQRVPHAFAIPLALAALATRKRDGGSAEGFLAAAALVLAAGAGLAIYHLGIEEHWWAGPQSCTGTGAGIPASVEELADAMRKAQIVACDVVAWSLFGISLAGFNAIFSTILAGLGFAPVLQRIFLRKSHDGTREAESKQVV
jgi:disulfide bond formation protein DsbB